MSFPTRNNFALRLGPSLAGTPVFIDTDAIYEDVRTSRLDPTSNPVFVGQILQYSASPPVPDDDGRYRVTAVSGTYAANLFAGYVANREYEMRERNIQHLSTTSREANNNIGRVEPGDAIPRTISPHDFWVETNLAVGATVTTLTPVHVLAKAGEGGIVSNAGGVVTPALTFTGLIKVSQDTGRTYASVVMNTPPLV